MPTINKKPTDGFLSTVQEASNNTFVEVEDSFWVQPSIDTTRWDKYYPYQLIVVEANEAGKYTAVHDKNGTNKDFKFTLPFPPESINIEYPFAIGGGVSLGGYIEEHNGIPVKPIQLSGSLGVMPLRGMVEGRGTGNLATGIFAGTIAAGQRIATSAVRAAGSISGVQQFPQNTLDDSRFPTELAAAAARDAMSVTSGYAQMKLLTGFFENYANGKKKAENANWRLAFCIWKENAVYLVTPLNFRSVKTAASPLEYTYNLGMQAYKRVELETAKAEAASVYKPIATQPDGLSRVLNALLNARQVIEQSRNLLTAIGGDIDRAVFEPLRETTLFLKDAVNAPLALADLPTQVLEASQEAVLNFMATQSAFESFSGKMDASKEKVKKAAEEVQRLLSNYDAIRTGASTSVDSPSVSLGDKAASAAARDARRMNVASELAFLRNPKDNYGIYSNLPFASISPSPKAIKKVVEAREEARKLKRQDFERFRDGLVAAAADFADSVGAGDTTYNTTYRRSSIIRRKTPTDDDYQVMYALNRAVMAMNELAASGTINRNKIKTVDYIAGLAQRSGIAFRIPRAKILVPFVYGHTLEKLAARYLGDPDRWMEIAALNGLRSPWVDEEGFDLTLLTNGSENKVYVADASELYVGQLVSISSNLVSATARRITDIRKIATSNYSITLDGDDDLGQYSTLAAAKLHATLPGTVNSQMMIYVPSTQAPAEVDDELKAIPGINQYDQLLAVGGVDVMLNDSGDVVITPDGDNKYVVGMQNIIQTAKIRLSTPQGTLHRHPTFGLPVKVGQSVADLSAEEILTSVKNMFNDDPAFSGVPAATVRIAGPAVAITLGIEVRGLSGVVPITFNLRK